MAKALTISAFPPCRAASAVQMAVSTMSATSATGGVHPSTVAATLTSGTWTTTRTPTTTSTVRATCSVFVVYRTRRVGFGYAQPTLIERSRNERCNRGRVGEKNLHQGWCGSLPTDDNEASFFIHKKIEGKDVKLRVWAVIFESKKIKKFNHLLEDGKNIRETLKYRFDMKEGELRAVFRSKGKDSWEFLGVFKFTGEDKPNDFEKLDMPKDCFTNCYERVSDELKLEDWQNEN